MTAATTPPTTVPTGLATGHVGLNVSDLDRSVAFYRRALGLDLAGEGRDGDQRWAYLAARGRLLLTLWQQADGPYRPGAAGLHHLAFQVDTIDEVRAAEARLREAGAAFAHDGVVPHGEAADSGGVFFHDPDGTRLEIYAPTGAGGSPAPHGPAPTCGFF